MSEIFDEWPEIYDQWFETPIGSLVRKYENELVLEMILLVIISKGSPVFG